MRDLYDHDLEKRTLGIIANTSSTGVHTCRTMVEQSKLSTLDFHRPENSAIFKIADALLREGKPVDPFGIRAQVGQAACDQMGGWQYLTEVLAGQSELVEMPFTMYADQLKDMSVRRKIIEELKRAAIDARDFDKNPGALLSGLTNKMAGMAQSSGSIRTLQSYLDDITDEIDLKQESLEPILRTGIKVFDSSLGGLPPTLIVVGGLPGVGKSALIASLNNCMAVRGVKVGNFSLEDDGSWIGWRVLAHESGVNQFHLRFSQLNDVQLQKSGGGYAKLKGYAGNVLIKDGSETGMTPDEIILCANDMILNHGVKFIIIDHLGEVLLPGNDISREVARCLSKLRGVANRHKVPVLVAAHFKRRDGLGPGDEPNISDFADSSGAERRARLALGLFREPGSDVLKVAVLKNTLGKAGFVIELPFAGASAMIRAVEGDQ